jgi:2-hydroxychromene-2-carboxylate isomerase
MAAPTLDFWFEFSSTYSYPAALRIGALAAEAGVEVRLRPFLLGPIFQAHGWNTSPFILYPAKGRHMWRDLERICAELSLPFRRPEHFPQSGLLAARVALIGLPHQLRAQTAEAQRLEIFGAPTFVTADGELFWGNDRMESAIAWAKRVC